MMRQARSVFVGLWALAPHFYMHICFSLLAMSYDPQYLFLFLHGQESLFFNLYTKTTRILSVRW